MIRRSGWGDLFSLALLAALALSILFWVPLYKDLGIGGALLRSGLGGLVLVAGIAGVGFAFADQRRGRDLRLSLIVPLILLAGWWLSGMLAPLGTAMAAQHAIARHAGDFRPMRPRLPPVYMVEGVPDGGSASVESDRGVPARGDAGLRNETVNGNLTSCRRVRSRYWVCPFG